MPDFVLAIIAAIVGIVVGFVVARYIVNASVKKKHDEAETIITDAKRQADTIKREAEVEAKDEALRLKAEIEDERKERDDKAFSIRVSRRGAYLLRTHSYGQYVDGAAVVAKAEPSAQLHQQQNLG